MTSACRPTRRRKSRRCYRKPARRSISKCTQAKATDFSSAKIKLTRWNARSPGSIAIWVPTVRASSFVRIPAIRWCLLGIGLLLAAASQSATATKIIIHAGHLIADPGKPSLDKQSIIVEKGKITAIVDGFVDGGRIIDLSQAWVMPGLIDMHTHVTVTMDVDSETPTSDFMPAFIGRPAARVLASEGRANSIMHNGFTTIRNLGDPASVTYDLRDAINAGEIEGPRIVACETMFGVPGGDYDA